MTSSQAKKEKIGHIAVFFFCGIVLVGLLFGFLRHRHSRQLHAPKEELGMWYWHSPFVVTSQQSALLRSAGFTSLYVRAATFTTDGAHAFLSAPIAWQSGSQNLKINLVFNFDAGLVSHFEILNNASLAADVSGGITKEVQRCARSGIRVSGIQLDVDCPTRLLPKYAQLIKAVRGNLKANGVLSVGQTFSITGLQTWLTSKYGYREISDACDFVAPQFYEGGVGKTLFTVQPLSDSQNLARNLQRADSFDKPFLAGLSTYGHALMYDPNGRLSGMYHGFGPEVALRHPYLTLEKSGKVGDEQEVVMKVNHPDQIGQALGFHIAYIVPTAESLQRQVDIWRTSKTANCLGAILFRFPADGDEMALPLETIVAILRQQKPALNFQIRYSEKSIPWEMIDEGSSNSAPQKTYRVRMISTGTAATQISKEALQILVSFSGEGLESVRTGDFDGAVTGHIEGDSFYPCSPPQANGVLLTQYHVLPGANLLSGDLVCHSGGPQIASIRYIAHGSDGTVKKGETFVSNQGKLQARRRSN